MLTIKSIFHNESALAIPGMLVRWQTDDRVPPEYGVVSSTNTQYIFVRFFGDVHSKACEPYGLTAG